MSAEVIGFRYRTKSLFWELSPDKTYCKYSLKKYDYTPQGSDITYPSLYRLYMEMEDLLEFEFANRYFDSYEHWELISKLSYMKEDVAQWRKEVELKVRARALRELRDLSITTEDSKVKVDLNKYLLNRGWIDKTNTKGRPSKEEIKKELERVTAVEKELQEDFERIH